MIETPTRPLIRYFGGKWKIASWVISYFPEHRIYVEPFGGSGSVLLRKPKSYSEVYNDIDSELFNLFRVCRDNGKKLKELLELTPYSREEYYLSFVAATDDLERARRLIVRATFGYGSDSAFRKSGLRTDTNREYSTSIHNWYSFPDAFSAIIVRLNGVLIENNSFERIIPAHDTKNSLFYLDPPYMPETRTYGKYKYEMTREQHLDLCNMIKNVKGKVVISEYENSIYTNQLWTWNRVEKPSKTMVKTDRSECLWMNF